ncbi:MAG TPA: WD40 repeat domain-containing protein [Aggregatilineales bacterium]|mgnify:CR=1 FL=1|nr:WD40 repeat domain-containing protein [Aggregatilineales bacterium]
MKRLLMVLICVLALGLTGAVAFAQEALTPANAGQVTLLRTLEGHIDAVTAVAFSPEGDLLASAGDDTSVRLWDTANGQQTDEQYEHLSFAKAVAFGPEGDLLASAGWDRRLLLWTVSGGTAAMNRVVEGFTAVIDRIAFSPDGDLIVFGVGDGVIRVADTVSGEIVQAFQVNALQITDVAFSPDGALIAGAGGFPDTTVILLDAATGEAIASLTGHSGSATALAFHPDGEILASAGDDGTVRLWDVAGGTQVANLLQEDWVTDLAFSPDGNLLAVALQDGSVRLWDFAGRAEIAYIQAHAGVVTSVTFSPDGDLLATAGDDGLINLWGVN